MTPTTRQSQDFRIQPQIEVSLTRQDIDTIMCMALDNISSWCQRVEIAGKQLCESASSQIASGGVLIFHSAEKSCCWELTLSKFLNGLKLYFERGLHVKVDDNRIDLCDVAGSDADCIVQFALFGEVVYA